MGLKGDDGEEEEEEGNEDELDRGKVLSCSRGCRRENEEEEDSISDDGWEDLGVYDKDGEEEEASGLGLTKTEGLNARGRVLGRAVLTQQDDSSMSYPKLALERRE